MNDSYASQIANSLGQIAHILQQILNELRIRK